MGSLVRFRAVRLAAGRFFAAAARRVMGYYAQLYIKPHSRMRIITGFMTFRLPWLIILVGSICATGWGVHVSSQNAVKAQTEFEALASANLQKLQEHFSFYANGLRGARGGVLAGGGEAITRDQFSAYMSSHEVAREFPGARGFGFIRRVPQDQERSFLARMRREGAAEFRIRELAPHDGDRYVIQSIEPVEQNRQAVGLDIASEDNRRTAALAAAQSGQPVLTAPITLVQATGRPRRGFLFLLPVQRHVRADASPAERLAATYGWVYAPLVIDEVLSGFDETSLFALALTDKGGMPRDTPFYATPAELHPTVSGLSKRILLSVYGREWQMNIQAQPLFVKRLNLPNPYWEAGVVMLLFCLIALALHYYRRAVQRTVQQQLSGRIGDAAPEATLVVDEQGHIAYANQRALDLFGYARGELEGETIETLVPERFRVRHITDRSDYDHVTRTMGAGRDLQARRKDGSVIPVEVSLGSMDVAGARQVIAMVVDISARRQAEEKLRAATRLLDSIVENVPNMIFLKRASDLRFEYFNRAGEELLGVKRETLLGHNDHDFFPREQADFFTAKDREVLRQHDVVDIAEETLDTQHGPRTLHTKKLVLRDERGRAEYLLGISEDITERKRIEASLHESEERWRFALEGSGDGVWDWNVLSGEVRLSQAGAAMFGYAEEDISHISTWFSRLQPEDQERWQMLLREFFHAGRERFAIEYPVRCKDGQYKWVLTRGMVASRTADGRVERMIGVHTDIDARKKDEVMLREAKEAAERASRAKSEFLDNMSHELRTPLTAIMGFGQLLEYDEDLGDIQRDSAHEIVRAGQHLLGLVNEILDLAKVEAGKIELSLEPVGLADLLSECRSLVRPLAEKRGIALERDSVGALQVRADRSRLKQVLLNLLSNAIKYNRENGTVRIVRQPAAPGLVRLAVSDTGRGIPPERLNELFQPFNRLDAGKSAIEGTGIGLSITRRLIELMGGEVGVESTVGEGSTFWIELPETVDESAIAATQLADLTGKYEAKPDHAHTVLYIEDNPINIKLISQILTRRPQIRLLTAHAPELGIELAFAHLPDLILLDINMPGMDGYQVLQSLRANAVLDRTPVIAVTANAMPREIRRGIEAGFTAYVTKPVDVEQFLQAVDEALAHAPERAENKER